MKREWQQTMLTRTTEDGTLQVLTCWLEVDKRIKEGTILSLKGETERWKVEKQFRDLKIDFPPENLDRRWGLALPKSMRTER